MNGFFEFVSNTNDGAFAVDDDQRVVCWNAAAERLLRFRARDVIGRACFDLLHGTDPEGAPICRRNCFAVCAARQRRLAPSVELTTRRNGDGPVRLNVSTIVVPPAWNSLSSLVHMFREVQPEPRPEAAHPRGIGSGWATVPPARGDRVLFEASTPLPLTPREREVLRQLASGAPTRVIASRLCISPTTVRNHAQHILAKLGVHSRIEAVTFAARRGLL